jgi:hypothetical protein
LKREGDKGAAVRRACAPEEGTDEAGTRTSPHKQTRQPGAAKKNWQAMWTDPGFQELLKSEQTDKTVEKIDATYMRPTDFSPLK